VDALARTRNPELNAILRSHLNDETDPRLRRRIVRILANLCPESELGALTESILDPDPHVRREVLLSLAARGYRPVFPLAVLGTADANSEVRSVSLKILLPLGSGLLFPLLEELISHPRAELRQAALTAIGFLKEPALASLIGRVVEDEDSAIRLQAQACRLSYLRLRIPCPLGDEDSKTVESLSTAGGPDALAESGFVVADGGEGESSEDSTNTLARHEKVQQRMKSRFPDMYEQLYGRSAQPMDVPVLSDADDEVETESDLSAEDETCAPRWMQEACRSCDFVKMHRPDQQKMGPGRLWCAHFKKEVASSHSCSRGRFIKTK